MTPMSHVKTKRLPYLLITAVAVLLISIVPFAGRGEYTDNSAPYPAELYALCFDGIDNDRDGYSDTNDPDCPRCFDGIDNDNDGLIDEQDPDCPDDTEDYLATNNSNSTDNFAPYNVSNNQVTGGGFVDEDNTNSFEPNNTNSGAYQAAKPYNLNEVNRKIASGNYQPLQSL